MRPPLNEDRQVWDLLEGVRDADPVRQARAHANRRARELRTARGTIARRRGQQGAVFAAAAAAAAVVLWIGPASSPMDAGALRLRTELNERRTVILNDGSVVTLNSATELRVTLRPDERRVELLDGEAHFAVAKDSNRPFRVRAGKSETEALGTQFDVARLAQQTTVTLIEGRVAVRTLPDQGAVAPTVEQLQPGQQLSISGEGRIASRRTMRIDGVMAWQKAQIDVSDATVAELIADANRYGAVKIVVQDPVLLQARISGVFRAGDTEAVVSALQRYFQLRAVHGNGRVVLEKM